LNYPFHHSLLSSFPSFLDKGRKEKNRGEESIWVIIHKYMEMLQGSSLYSYLKQKCHFSFFYEMEEQEDGTGPV
jgi:hypothetical protein